MSECVRASLPVCISVLTSADIGSDGRLVDLTLRAAHRHVLQVAERLGRDLGAIHAAERRLVVVRWLSHGFRCFAWRV